MEHADGHIAWRRYEPIKQGTSRTALGSRLPVNVARGGVAQQADGGRKASALIDGDNRTNATWDTCTTLSPTLNAWWRVDLLVAYDVVEVEVTSADCCTQDLTGAEVLVGDSLLNNGNANPRCAAVPSANDNAMTFKCNMVGRYVNVHQRNGFNWVVCEVKVYGTFLVEGEKDPDWMFDLKKVYRIEAVFLSFNEETLPETLNGAEIRVGFSLVKTNTRCAVVDFESGILTYRYKCANLEGRFVFVVLPGIRKTLGLCNPYIFGMAVAWSQWMRVDLLVPHNVTSIQLFNEKGCCSSVEVKVGNSPYNNGYYNPRCGWMTRDTESILNCTGMVGRYVNLYNPYGGLSVSEVEVYGRKELFPSTLQQRAPSTDHCSEDNCSRDYVLVTKSLTWAKAREYCRQHYTDMAIISNAQDMNRLQDLADLDGFWIGLYQGVPTWTWALWDGARYGAQTFRNWEGGEPVGKQGKNLCAAMNTTGEWKGVECHVPCFFVCYDVSTGSLNVGQRSVLVATAMTFQQARDYCQALHTDLVLIRDATDNREVQAMVPEGALVWIGLYAEPWAWADGSGSSFRYWRQTPSYWYLKATGYQYCAFVNLGMWDWRYCGEQHAFICYSSPEYHYYNQTLSWNDARDYCRTKHSDLATVASMEEARLLALTAAQSDAWIGLRLDELSKWVWSDGSGEPVDTFWQELEPDFATVQETCAETKKEGWNDVSCSTLRSFVCQSAVSSHYVSQSQSRTWTDAQDHCRSLGMDLPTVRSWSQNKAALSVPGNTITWVGLFLDQWAWSDGSPSSLRHWSVGRPANFHGCAIVSARDQGRWDEKQCDARMPFVCHGGLKSRTRLMKLKMSSDGVLDHPAAGVQLLQQLEVQLKSQGISDFTLSWRSDIYRQAEINTDSAAEGPGPGNSVLMACVHPELSSSVLREELTCPVCLDVYRDPRLLPCGHNFCLGCLRRLQHQAASQRGHLHCPECRESHRCSTTKFQKNFKLANIADDFRRGRLAAAAAATTATAGEPSLGSASSLGAPPRSAAQLSVPCDYCPPPGAESAARGAGGAESPVAGGERGGAGAPVPGEAAGDPAGAAVAVATPAVKTCLKCEVSMCGEHVRPHLELPAFREHPLTDPLDDLRSRKCPSHDEIYRYYCLDDKVCVCNACTIEGGHAGHSIKTLRNTARDMKESLDKQLYRLERRYTTTEKKVHEQREKERQNRKFSEDSEQCLGTLGEELKAKVDCFITQLRGSARGHSDANRRVIQKNLQRVGQDQARLQEVRCGMETLLLENDHFRFIQAYKTTRKQCRRQLRKSMFYPEYVDMETDALGDAMNQEMIQFLEVQLQSLIIAAVEHLREEGQQEGMEEEEEVTEEEDDDNEDDDSSDELRSEGEEEAEEEEEEEEDQSDSADDLYSPEEDYEEEDGEEEEEEEV
ncbi:unnamed protein product [Lota lota]